MKRLKLFENFKQDWLNKISDLKKEAENDALSKIQEFFYDLTDDFDNDEVHVEVPEYTPIGGKPFLQFVVDFDIKSSKIEEFILRLSDVKLRLQEALGFNIKVSQTFGVKSEMSSSSSHFTVLDIETYTSLEDILNGKLKSGDESYDHFFDDILQKVVSYRLGLPRNEMSEILQRDEILFKFRLFIS